MRDKKTVLITGCSTGIGNAAAVFFAHKGFRVFASMRNLESAESTMLEDVSKTNSNLEIVQLDVTNSTSSMRAVDYVLSRASKLDILINNAGISGGGPVEELNEEALRRTFDTNFFGAVRMMKLVIPAMRESGGGTIVNISSVDARVIGPFGTGYNATKAALEVASEAAAQELRRFNIRVVLIEPGLILTPIFEKQTEGQEFRSDSPYAEFVRRRQQVFEAIKSRGLEPETVSEGINAALEDRNPKFRYVIGEDAHNAISARQGISDEEWIDSGREMSLSEYAKWLDSRLGFKI